ncbi:MAG: bifunctional [glutamine synthetase] adenylyltransferase/[glutamine synthetase]-adenylyl-L-tyrosine phosphorylase [Brevundimonas sp.]|uniref:bifunctional [glutamine synthetase] adenylyltransferase/[glutamine synthetase]-adenylyl-L-tyrosine phosphorylase n=1 Tax=Brevundimonas sp. TaxID=1871086 RepID=UPI0027337630|nr:bifunctional [glutamine synthetase] adenylyltransferase/[glutamine synthetase]-adenylyl-L-tyrosine phosphorylase [Brevundimonas sp.]MDP3369922.1 bifunctional [glutamine synthetase] adenylyltransferase/[glutamine synthetase]-adenylyl-L-tyrosine phosphorylase [Brevundimonas sp.]MDP3658370.1 bifunctional [glutamine synthetase] adenylyltransferase/[glutamine synthetase]-adenylyl-L-tyrosine phosphorylase [Brevundimonas sp.]MDZ4109610.1 bifunctional [glutamine synthetase] adenylyltransferase/[gluta
MSGPLGPRLAPCGPIVDAVAADRARERLSVSAREGGWTDGLDAAWPALAPAFAASPYLAGLARRWPERLRLTLESPPEARFSEILSATTALTGGADDARAPLRWLKAELHLLTALADLGGVWDLDAVTDALSRFADVSSRAALRAVAHDQRQRGRLISTADDPRGPVPGLFGLAMGKHGAFELNYSSDIDISLFWEPEALESALAEGVEPQKFADRAAHALASLMQERTGDGYVFRVDLRLRPDPSSTPPVVAAPMALAYYESVGQNWERAAFIKARPVIGDLAAGADFLKALRPFIWRRSLDYPAILDIQSIKRQIHVHKTGEGMDAAGANLKLGRGGIREIEFFAQTQQLILGGRDPGLRSPRTVEALAALRDAGHVTPDACTGLTEAYVALRGLEHRVQMLEDEQTHVLPTDPIRRAMAAALAGEGDLAVFDRHVETLLLDVNRTYGELFEGEEALSSPYGSLVFTGVENDPETLATLERMGFAEPAGVADTIRSWHHGRIPATRSARGRELFTRLAPRLLTALADTGAADAAFRRFAVFFAGLNSGVQVQALFLAQPHLFDLVVGVMAFAPRLARTLGRYPAALDSMLDARFGRAIDEDSGLVEQLRAEAAAATDFETALDAARRVHREQMFRIGLQTLAGHAGPEAAGRAYTALADAVMDALAPAAMAEAVRQGGALQGGAVAVVALGKAGSREMTASSDLDLMTVYDAPPEAVSDGKGWAAGVFYSRFTQRLIAALSAHTAEGGLYEVDMRLRPGAAKGPVSLRLSAIEDYYATEADTWEFMALTRARVVWTDDPAFGARAAAALEAILRRPRPGVDVAADARRMRDLMARERPGQGVWDLKLAPGGQVDAEFVAQVRQLTLAAAGGPLTVSTLEALSDDPALAEAWRLQQALSQVLGAAFDDRPDPDQEPEGFRRRLAEAADLADFDTLKARLTEVRTVARAAFESVFPRPRDGD